MVKHAESNTSIKNLLAMLPKAITINILYRHRPLVSDKGWYNSMRLNSTMYECFKLRRTDSFNVSRLFNVTLQKQDEK